MKNLDIENLERKNIYKVPDESFFAEMQAKVLQETAPKKETKVVKLNWVYAAAAAVAMVFGITFVMNQNETTANQNLMTTQVSNEKADAVSVSESIDKPENEATIAYQTLQNDLTSTEEIHPKEDEAQVKVVDHQETKAVAAKNVKTAVQTPEVQVDQILSSFTSAELADLGNNAEQDIYLDLYN
ncbi:hypothetical protein [Kaistella montana]|uniref:Anti-sigma factor n=1 Tax=Kaistella montana TaxID=1849733 RepID=A0ABW5KB92_9FLAO|nr:hypothetical protein [Kaistella montana]MCQ4035811.1 hypothetical protein [Kaistella montana]